MNKKILLSLGTLVVAGAVIAGGTGAFFTDTEVSAGNTFAAGAVDVEIQNITSTYDNLGNGEDVPQFVLAENGGSFSLNDIKPLDTGSIDYDVVNNGNPAFVCAAVTEAGNAENTRNEAELEAGDGTPNIGELGDFLTFKFGGATGTLATISGMFQGTADEVETGANTDASIEYCFGEFNSAGACVAGAGEHNLAQTDSVDVDVTFEAIQQRNNSGFVCADLNEDVTPPVEPEPEVLGATITNPTDGGNFSRATDFVAQTTGLPSLDSNDTARFELFNSTTCSGAPFLSRIGSANPGGEYTLDGNAFSAFVGGTKCIKFTLYNNAQTTTADDVIVQSDPVTFTFTN